MKLRVEVGEEEIVIVAGMAKEYAPEDSLGQKVDSVANRDPAKRMGISAQGMILCAADKSGADEILSALTTLAPLPSGLKVS